MKKLVWSAAFVFAYAMVGCGGSGSSGGASVRAVNAIPSATATATLTAGATILMEGASYPSFSAYQNVPANGAEQFLLTNASGATLAEPTVAITAGSSYTAYAVGPTASPNVVVLPEDHSTPPSNDVRMNFVNLSPTISSVDVYVTAPGVTTLSGLTANVSGVTFTTSQPFVVAATSTGYQVNFTVSGTQTILASYSTGALTAGQLTRYLLLDPATTGNPETIASLND